MEAHIIAILTLAEALILVGVGAFVLYRCYRRVSGERYQLAEQMRAAQRGAESYRHFLSQAQENLRRAYRTRHDQELAAQGLERFDPADPPGTVAQRLHYAFLQAELDALTAYQQHPAGFWPEKQGKAGWFALCFHAADQALLSWQNNYEALRRQAEAAGERDDSALQAELAEAQERLEDVLAYRERFKRLHGLALDEISARGELLARLREGGGPVTPEALEAAFGEYDLKRLPLDSYLQQEDIAMLDERFAAEDAVKAAERRNERSRLLADRASERIRGSVQEVREVAETQRSLIGEMRSGMASDEERNKLIETYQGQIQGLERTVNDAERCIEVLESENERQRRTIDRLLKRLSTDDDREAKIRMLEESVDRFSRQAMDLTAKLYALQKENEELRGQQGPSPAATDAAEGDPVADAMAAQPAEATVEAASSDEIPDLARGR